MFRNSSAKKRIGNFRSNTAIDGNCSTNGRSPPSKKDGTWKVKIIVTHNRNKVHIENQHFATQKQLRKDYTIKDQFILSTLNPELDAYRKKISELGEKLNLSVNSVIMNAEIQTLHKVWSAN